HSWTDLPALIFPGDGKTEVIDRTIDVTDVPTIGLTNNVGSVRIEPGNDDSKVVVHIVKHAATSHLLSTLKIEISQNGNQIFIRTTGNGFNHGPFGGNS